MSYEPKVVGSRPTRRICHLAREVQGGALKMLCVVTLVGSNPTDGINEFNSNYFSNLDTKIKIISPKITIDRFFQNEDPYLIVEDLIELSNPIDEEETLFIYPEGILTNIYLNELALYKKIFLE